MSLLRSLASSLVCQTWAAMLSPPTHKRLGAREVAGGDRKTAQCPMPGVEEAAGPTGQSGFNHAASWEHRCCHNTCHDLPVNSDRSRNQPGIRPAVGPEATAEESAELPPSPSPSAGSLRLFLFQPPLLPRIFKLHTAKLTFFGYKLHEF